MFLTPILMLFMLAAPQPQPAMLDLSNGELIATAHKLALDEGWPIDQPGYSLDPMQPMREEEFYSIGLYRNAHLLRMYSIHRQTGDIVDFMHGCDLIQFDDVKPLQQRIRNASKAAPFTREQLAAKAGCPRLNLVNTRWVK
jgi:hypothetical protein